MSEISFAQMLETAKAEGLSTGELLPNGNYTLECVYVKPGTTKAGAPKIWLKWEVTEGPNKGETASENLNINTSRNSDGSLTDGAKISQKIFIQRIKSLGITEEFLNQDPSLDEIAESLHGVVAEQELGEKNGWQTFKLLNLLEKEVKAVAENVPGFLQGAQSGTSFLGAQN